MTEAGKGEFEGHTPGPWTYEFVPADGTERERPQKEWSGLYVGPADDEGRLHCTLFEGAVTHGFTENGFGDPDADARLIAAAPDLLRRALAAEALIERIADALQTDERGDNLVSVARAACMTEQELASAMGGEFSDIATRLAAAEAERDRCREALTEIARMGAPFDAKGTHSKRVVEIACAALDASTPASTQKEEGRVKKLEEALEKCAAPAVLFADMENAYDILADEFRRRIKIANDAISPSDDAKGGGE